MNLVTLTTTGQQLGRSPFLTGGDAIAINLSASSATIQGADTLSGTYTTLATVPATTMMLVTNLPKFVKLSAAGTGVYLQGSGGS
ncbi:hypothetical protein [Pseudoxanthomonas sp. X-1]|uniref:hypothetical protein n=1 Tax=Pseudoxanthomonas sp. X-1 TaxID=2571115 RepID=UPI00110ABF11|nr:hypothetical protein [Pseudoxanthomonas sp. X-1]TMN18474.1 hypothetical protein FF950_14420 [Pseudoxanthomonas sp. X-1]UAY76024.1 hypothetical protein LAJ50_07255 [Pseudoxanthomonas sp. X-1]